MDQRDWPVVIILTIVVILSLAWMIASSPSLSADLEPGFRTGPLVDEYRNPITGAYCCNHEDRFRVPAGGLEAVEGGYRVTMAAYGRWRSYFVPADHAQVNRDDGGIWAYILGSSPDTIRCLLLPATM